MDFNALTSPLHGDTPCGEDLGFSAEFDQIAEMRREDDPTLSQGDWVTSLKVADWYGVSQLCQSLLTNRSKDLRLTMWLTEAQAHLNGYAGLHSGLKLAASLCHAFWSSIYPMPDGDDMDERVGNLGWLLLRVQQFATNCAITKGKSGEQWSLRDFAQARQQSASSEESSTKPSVEQLQQALRATPAAFIHSQLDDLRGALSALQDLQQTIDQHLGADGPSFVAAREALDGAIHDLDRMARDVGIAHEPDQLLAGQIPAQADSATSTQADTVAARHGPVQTRQQALDQLRDVARYFRRTEPHSPVAYLAEKAVKWAEMPLHEWLRHVVKDQGAMGHLEELLGLQQSDSQNV